MKRIIAAALLALYLAGAGGARAASGSDRLLAVGGRAPDFTFTEVQSGGAMALDNVGRGRPLLLVFLQTSCQSCARELQSLKDVRAAGAPIEVLGIFIDVTARDFQKYVADNALPFVFGWDSGNAIAEAYGVPFAPASFLLDRERKIAAVYRGFHPGIEQALRADFARLAKGP
ncbi:MAG: TlpA family protein disulfide reductase [Deltaproteobacteria bacterium]|nr:TlpA family protein disulfide reductase [Deltaproteobacteria bacterium]